jgi:List-Bact-rpt repeat protein
VISAARTVVMNAAQRWMRYSGSPSGDDMPMRMRLHARGCGGGVANTRRVLRGRAALAVMLIGAAGCGDEPAVGTQPATNHVLRVQGDGAGSGTVTTPDQSPQLSCSITQGALAGVCAMAYPGNSTVRLVATPNVGSTFTGWSGACTGTDQCVVDMSNERVVTAAFAAK